MMWAGRRGTTKYATAAPPRPPATFTHVRTNTFTPAACWTPISMSQERTMAPPPPPGPTPRRRTAEPSARTPPPALTSKRTVTGRSRGVTHATLKGVGATGAEARHRNGRQGREGGPLEAEGPWAVTRTCTRTCTCTCTWKCKCKRACTKCTCTCTRKCKCKCICCNVHGYVDVNVHGYANVRVDVNEHVSVNANVNVNVFSLGLSNAIEEQQVHSALWDMPMLQGVCPTIAHRACNCTWVGWGEA
jgi:hypothetical protein